MPGKVSLHVVVDEWPCRARRWSRNRGHRPLARPGRISSSPRDKRRRVARTNRPCSRARDRLELPVDEVRGRVRRDSLEDQTAFLPFGVGGVAYRPGVFDAVPVVGVPDAQHAAALRIDGVSGGVFPEGVVYDRGASARCTAAAPAPPRPAPPVAPAVPPPRPPPPRRRRLLPPGATNRARPPPLPAVPPVPIVPASPPPLPPPHPRSRPCLRDRRRRRPCHCRRRRPFLRHPCHLSPHRLSPSRLRWCRHPLLTRRLLPRTRSRRISAEREGQENGGSALEIQSADGS